MIKIKFDRESVCMGDDIGSHETFFDVDEKMTINEFIGFLYSKPNIFPKISGGKATWILQIEKENFYRNIAVFAQQWKTAKYLNSNLTIGEIIRFKNPTSFYAKYLAQKDPENVYNSLKELKLLDF